MPSSLGRHLEDEVEVRLAGHGFIQRDLPAKRELWPTTEDGIFHEVRTPRARKLIKTINDETEIFLFPGVQRSKGKIRVDPVIGVDNLRLRARMLSTGEEWRNAHSVCHVYLGILAGWNVLYLTDAAQIAEFAQRIADSTVEAMPFLQKYDSLSKVRELFIADLNRTGPPHLAVFFAEEKLPLTLDN